MKLKTIKKGVGLGAAAAVSVGLSGCPDKKDEPRGEETSQVQQAEEQDEAAAADEGEQTPSGDDVQGEGEQTPSGDDVQGEGEQTPSGDDVQGEGEQTPSGDDVQGGATAKEPAAQKLDCDGKDRFTEKCGYPSPARYGVLDPASIVNSNAA
jgi:hypothetical protein